MTQGPRRVKERKEYPMSNYFKVKEHGSTVRTEIMAGVTTFMAMAYILMVNAGMFASLGTVSYGAIDRKSTRLNSSHITRSRMPSSA